MLTALFSIFAIVWLLYRLYTYNYSYFAKRGFPFVEPHFPYGSSLNFALLNDYQGYLLDEIYQKLRGHPYGGYYLLRLPILLIRSPEIIRHVLIKDFSHFRNRFQLTEDPQDILAQHLFALSGDKWRALRIKLTPTFTSGKMKMMFPLFQSCSRVLDTFLQKEAKIGGVIDIKEVMANFTTDIIGTCAFGLDIGAIENPDNEFRKIGKKIIPTGISLMSKIKIWLDRIFPSLRNIVRLQLTPMEVVNFMTKVVKETVDFREKNNITRNDFLDLLIDLKNKSAHEKSEEKSPMPLEFTTELMTAQVFIFFAAGFETSSSVMSYCFYELAKHPEIQDRLRKEIDEVAARHGEISYQALMEMPYLEQVLDETMRKYPTLPFLHRVCEKRYQMPDTGLIVEPGQEIRIPVYSIHHDPKYYPNPEVFDPERFTPSRKKSIPSCVYLPFGEGPRICIGLRFGYLQAKMGVASVLSKFFISTTEETQKTLHLTTSALVTSVKGPILLKVTQREQLRDA